MTSSSARCFRIVSAYIIASSLLWHQSALGVSPSIGLFVAPCHLAGPSLDEGRAILLSGDEVRVTALLADATKDLNTLRESFDILCFAAESRWATRALDRMTTVIREQASSEEKHRAVDGMWDCLNALLRRKDGFLPRHEVLKYIATTVCYPEAPALRPSYGVETLIRTLGNCLDDEDCLVRRNAIEWLGNLGALPECKPEVVRLLQARRSKEEQASDFPPESMVNVPATPETTADQQRKADSNLSAPIEEPAKLVSPPSREKGANLRAIDRALVLLQTDFSKSPYFQTPIPPFTDDQYLAYRQLPMERKLELLDVDLADPVAAARFHLILAMIMKQGYSVSDMERLISVSSRGKFREIVPSLGQPILEATSSEDDRRKRDRYIELMQDAIAGKLNIPAYCALDALGRSLSLGSKKIETSTSPESPEVLPYGYDRVVDILLRALASSDKGAQETSARWLDEISSTFRYRRAEIQAALRDPNKVP
jgi:hypothetical protein